ncbi:signal peptidase II [Sinomonas sp. ASV322]|uniref:signal peptidase II n=1 Tax=Sinomonas sp. ASV322 TaxID=3041920 RepID=UPI0027DE8DF1|nr:signal peptidase II [Sinomonas sp. ASV322]MDQ4500815.1 signal peptidase II [Sinomonas sp. ASV322]
MENSSVTPSQGPEPSSNGRRRVSGRAIAVLAALAVVVYTFDQLTKLWVTSTMVEGERTAVLPPLLHWYYIRNSGAAFSIGENVTWVFSIIMTAVSVAIILYARRVRSLGWAVALGLVLGGALGNLTDRLFREPSFGMGHVVDFIQLPNFAIFNVADSCVVTGVALICLLTLLGVGADGSRHGKARSAAGRADQGEPDGSGRPGEEPPRA